MSPQEELELLRPAAIGLAAVRVWCGLWFLILAWAQRPMGAPAAWNLPDQLARFAARCAAEGAPPFCKPLLDFAATHGSGCAWVLVGFEVGAGFLLVVGLFTRPTAVAAALVHVGYWLATLGRGSAHAGLAMTITVTTLCLALGDAGRFYGLDRLRRRGKPTGSPARA